MNPQESEIQLLRLLCRRLQLGRGLSKASASIAKVLEHGGALPGDARDLLCAAVAEIALVELCVRDEVYSLAGPAAEAVGLEGGE
jgi:predicted nucleic acid-binding protein